jgi:hypothetical protein
MSLGYINGGKKQERWRITLMVALFSFLKRF